MESYFTSLTKRQTMLLVTAVTLGGQDAASTFDHLPEAEAAILKHRAQSLLQIPKEQRIGLLVTEMKRLVQSKRGELWAADPKKLAEALKGERATLVDGLLRALPASLASAVRQYLPAQMQRVAAREIKPQVLQMVRWKLEGILHRAGASRATFRFVDLRGLQGRELLTLCEQLGVKVLAAAVASLPPVERDAFLAPLSPELKAAAVEAAQAANARKLLPEDGAELLRLHQENGTPLDAVRSAGAQKLVRAGMAQTPEFVAALLEAHRADLPPAFMRWFKEERTRTLERGDGGRTEVVWELERLAQKGWIEPPLRMLSVASAPPPSSRVTAPPQAVNRATEVSMTVPARVGDRNPPRSEPTEVSRTIRDPRRGPIPPPANSRSGSPAPTSIPPKGPGRGGRSGSR